MTPPPVDEAELEQMIRDTDANQQRDKRVLAELLQKAADRTDFILVHAAAMGKALVETGNPKTVPSYAATHTLEWISNNVKLGSQMPFMETKVKEDENGVKVLVIDEENAEELKQRMPDWSRQPALAAYLAQPQRKFGPIIAVLSPDWVDDPKHENWGVDGRALKSAADFDPLDLGGRVGLLRVGGVKLYALDGQHRVIGIQGLKDVRDDSAGLVMYNKDKRPTGDAMAKADFLEKFRMSIEDLQSVLNETMIVEYIPSVIQGETRDEATRRIRSIFISINSYAKSTAKGENILLDESDGYSILARKAGVFHGLFNDNGKHNRVNWKNTSIPAKRTTWYTTLQTIREMAESYLSAVDPERAAEWAPHFRGQMPIRPRAEALETAKEQFYEFLAKVHQLPTFQKLEQVPEGEQATQITLQREFPDEKSPDNAGNLLLRPVGQMILAEAVATLVRDKGLELAEIFSRLASLDERGGFEAHRAENAWYGVTFDPVKAKMNTGTSARRLAKNLLVYLIAGADQEELNQLWIDFAMARMVDQDAKTWRNLKGEVVEFDEGSIGLPAPISS